MCPPLQPDEDGVVRIGNPEGRIAVYLDEVEALDAARRLWPGENLRVDLVDAVWAAYPGGHHVTDAPPAVLDGRRTG